MKKITLPISLISVLVLILIIVSCIEEYPNSNHDIIDSNVSSGLAYDNLLTAGFLPENIVEKEDHFIVEDDIVIMKDEIDNYVFDCRKKNKNNKITQAATDGVVSISKVDDIYVKIHSSLKGTIWESAIRSAMSNWNNISNCRINFIEYTDSPPPPPGGGGKPPIAFTTQSLTYDILIISDDNPETPSCMSNLSSCARGRFPTNGNPGPYVSINREVADSKSNAAKIDLVMHELGHCLGFRHTDWGETLYFLGIPYGTKEDEDFLGPCEYIYGANTLAGTPGSNPGDPNSIMNSGSCGHTSGLSDYDLNGARALYPNTLDASAYLNWVWDYQLQAVL